MVTCQQYNKLANLTQQKDAVWYLFPKQLENHRLYGRRDTQRRHASMLLCVVLALLAQWRCYITSSGDFRKGAATASKRVPVLLQAIQKAHE